MNIRNASVQKFVHIPSPQGRQPDTYYIVGDDLVSKRKAYLHDDGVWRSSAMAGDSTGHYATEGEAQKVLDAYLDTI